MVKLSGLYDAWSPFYDYVPFVHRRVHGPWPWAMGHGPWPWAMGHGPWAELMVRGKGPSGPGAS